MIGRLLCFIGAHAWEFDSHLRTRHGYVDEISIARCGRRCSRYPTWKIVDITRLRRI